MTNETPTRVLGKSHNGTSAGRSHSDNPYESNAATTEAGSTSSSTAIDAREIDTFDGDHAEPTETTALLGNGNGTTKTTAKPSRPRQQPRRPLSLKIDYAIAVLLLLANVCFLLLTVASISSPFITHNALPPHRGSTFLPIWIALLSTATNVLALLAFVFPLEHPLYSAYSNVTSAFLLALIMILTMAVTQLRRHENILTLVVTLLGIASTLHAAFSAVLAARYAPILLAEPLPGANGEQKFTFGESLMRAMRGTWSFVHVTFPLIVLHTLIPLLYIMLTISVIIRTIDSSVEQPGQRWKVNPWIWSRQRFPEIGSGLWETGGREFQVHLSCRGVGIDDPIPPYLASSSTNSSELAFDLPEPTERKTVRRTILIEGDQGVAGRVSSDWVFRMLKDGDLTNGDFEIRVCFWDRPGYGFSDSSPSASTPQMVTALTQALTLAGEFARLEPAPTLNEAGQESEEPFAPTPLARSGFVLVSRTYGSLTSSLFATINPRLTHSFLYLSPLPYDLHFSKKHAFLHSVPAFFTRTLPAMTSELGFWAIGSVLKGRSRMSRVLSNERDAVVGRMKRAWLEEEHERDLGRDSLSYVAWNRKKGRYPERPTIVLSEPGGHKSRGRRYDDRTWDDAQQMFIDDVVKDGLVKHVKDWYGTCEGSGYEDCRKSLKKLVTMD
ncbi:hypothetical protein OIO90_000536 [Microbotryomycetes sp. JL221]|nr:hypothetical protein OIO90_000536 [Microbotryomycetes sp. JL221]